MKATMILKLEFDNPLWRDDADVTKSLSEFLERLTVDHPGVRIGVLGAKSINDDSGSVVMRS